MNQLWQSSSTVLWNDWLVAQTTAEPSWVTLLTNLETGKLAIVMVFGTAMIGAIGYAITSSIRAINGTPDDSEEINTRLASLELRLHQLEQKLHMHTE